MGGGESKEDKKAVEVAVNKVEETSTGMHLLEIHAPSIGHGAMFTLLLIVAGVGLWGWWRRRKEQRRRRRREEVEAREAELKAIIVGATTSAQAEDKVTPAPPGITGMVTPPPPPATSMWPWSQGPWGFLTGGQACPPLIPPGLTQGYCPRPWQATPSGPAYIDGANEPWRSSGRFEDLGEASPHLPRHQQHHLPKRAGHGQSYGHWSHRRGLCPPTTGQTHVGERGAAPSTASGWSHLPQDEGLQEENLRL